MSGRVRATREMGRPSRRRRALVAGLVAVLAASVLAACSGVPDSSAPQVVRSLDVGGQDAPEDTVTPVPGELPRNLVQDFLKANVSAAGKHASARTFLSPAARTKWTDTTVTVVSSLSVGNPVAGKAQIVASGKELGSVDVNGIYTPTLQGSKAPTVQFVFGITKIDGQYRISSLRGGLLLTETDFLNSFAQRNIYFFDLAEHFLVPDARWVADTDSTDLAEWLVNEMAAGPAAPLQNAVSTDTLPAQGNARHINVSSGTVVRIEIPGTSQLDPGSRNRLAAQISATLSDVDRGRLLEITDSGKPVTIPSAGGAAFTSSDFAATLVQPPVGEVYYLRDGRVVDEQRHRIGGAVNTGRFRLTSVAVSRSGRGGGLSIAGVAGVGGKARLLIGSQTAGLRETAVTGVTSRPAFAPDRVEAWVGAGTRVYCVTVSPRGAVTTPVALPTADTGFRVIALRLSPEGSRIAMVLRNQTGQQQLFTGAIVRAGGQVRVDNLQQISPAGVMVTDLAWVETERLLAIGYDEPSEDARIYQTGADGSAWSESGIGELPGPPSTLTVASGDPAWVTSGGAIYVQSGGTSWTSPGGGPAATGSAPVYVE